MARVLVNEQVSRVVGLSPGPQGPTGPTGATGPQGLTGPAGDAGSDGADGVGVPAGGSTGQVLTKASGTSYDTEWAIPPSGILETVSGGAGFIGVSGAVTMDLSTGRSFHHTMTGNITSLAFSNVPAAAGNAPAWTWVLAIDSTGGYLLSSTPTVTWVDGASFSDLDLSANAVNVVTFWQLGSTIYAALITNGALSLDPYVMSFAADGSQLVVVSRSETLDLGSVTHLEADGTAGTGTLSYKKNGVTATGSTSFTSGDVLEVTLASSTTPSVVSIPRSV